MLKTGVSVSHQQDSKIQGQILCPAGDGFYYVAVRASVFSIPEEKLTVTDEKSRLSEIDQKRFAKYLTAGQENGREGTLTNLNQGGATFGTPKANSSTLYADSELNVSRSAYPGLYLLTTSNARIANRINKVTQTYKDYVIRDGDEPQFHLNARQVDQVLKVLGKIRGEKVSAALKVSV